MNLWLRLIWLFITSKWRTPIDPLDICETHFICSPNDLDLLFHMNNGRYLTLMDLGRVDYMTRTGMWKMCEEQGFYPVVEMQTIRYKKSLELFDKFKITTQVVGWGEKSFYIEQKFIRKGHMVAEAVVKGRFLKKTRGTAAPAELLALLGKPTQSPELSDFIKKWDSAEH